MNTDAPAKPTDLELLADALGLEPDRLAGLETEPLDAESRADLAAVFELDDIDDLHAAISSADVVALEMGGGLAVAAAVADDSDPAAAERLILLHRLIQLAGTAGASQVIARNALEHVLRRQVREAVFRVAFNPKIAASWKGHLFEVMVRDAHNVRHLLDTMTLLKPGTAHVDAVITHSLSDKIRQLLQPRAQDLKEIAGRAHTVVQIKASANSHLQREGVGAARKVAGQLSKKAKTVVPKGAAGAPGVSPSPVDPSHLQQGVNKALEMHANGLTADSLARGASKAAGSAVLFYLVIETGLQGWQVVKHDKPIDEAVADAAWGIPAAAAGGVAAWAAGTAVGLAALTGAAGTAATIGAPLVAAIAVSAGVSWAVNEGREALIDKLGYDPVEKAAHAVGHAVVDISGNAVDVTGRAAKAVGGAVAAATDELVDDAKAVGGAVANVAGEAVEATGRAARSGGRALAEAIGELAEGASKAANAKVREVADAAGEVVDAAGAVGDSVTGAAGRALRFVHSAMGPGDEAAEQPSV